MDRLVEAFYARMDTMPGAGIRAFHAPDLSSTKEVLKRYLGEWMGGPPLYSRNAAIGGCGCAISASKSARRSATPG